VSIWVQVGENLVRHWSGTIYLRAKVADKIVRISLKTSDIRIAKIKRDDRLASLPVDTIRSERHSCIEPKVQAATDLPPDLSQRQAGIESRRSQRCSDTR
jgi:hypothetical protein